MSQSNTNTLIRLKELNYIIKGLIKSLVLEDAVLPQILKIKDLSNLLYKYSEEYIKLENQS